MTLRGFLKTIKFDGPVKSLSACSAAADEKPFGTTQDKLRYVAISFFM